MAPGEIASHTQRQGPFPFYARGKTRPIAANIAKLPVIRPARDDNVLPAFVACALLFWTGLIEALNY